MKENGGFENVHHNGGGGGVVPVERGSLGLERWFP